MQEFSSISVSSYEAGTLADQLTEQAGDGWSVVAIVPTGSTVTAYLSRDTDGADSPAEAVTAATPAAPIAEPTEPTPAEPSAAEPAAAEPATADAAESATDVAGWAPGAATSATDTTEAPATEASSPSIADAGADEHFTVASEPAAEAATATMGAAAAGAGAAPAGWYADPSSRFELRYWDGSQWTEHVSRAGQQYTDPPVA